MHARALGRSPGDALRAADIPYSILARRAPLTAQLELANGTIASEGVDQEPVLLARVLYSRARVWLYSGAVEKARADGERILELALRSGSRACEAQARILLASAASQMLGDHGETQDAHCEAAVIAARAAGSRRWERAALSALAIAQADRGRREQARDAFMHVIALAQADGDRSSAALARCRLGTVFMELGQLDQAERVLEEGTEALMATGCMATVLQSHVYNLATVRHERGHYEKAERAYRELIVEAAENTMIRSLSMAALGVLLASRDEVDEASRMLGEAEAGLRMAGATYATLVDLQGGHIDLALARRAARSGDRVASERLRTSARQRLTATASGGHSVDDVRTARRWLERAVELSASDGYPAEAWIVAEDGSWFRRPSGVRVDVDTLVKVRQVLRALLRSRIDEPGRALSIDEVLSAGWPGEKMLRRAAEARVYTIIKRLRNAGVRELVLSTDAGYFLDPDQPVVASSTKR